VAACAALACKHDVVGIPVHEALRASALRIFPRIGFCFPTRRAGPRSADGNGSGRRLFERSEFEPTPFSESSTAGCPERSGGTQTIGSPFSLLTFFLATQKESELPPGNPRLVGNVGLSADGVVVIAHDPYLNPLITRDAASQWLPGSRGPLIRSLSFAQLQAYDVGRIQPGTPYASTFGNQQPLDGTRIPTLAALFERVKLLGATAVRFNIETKLNPEQPADTASPEQMTDALLKVVRDAGMLTRISIQSFRLAHPANRAAAGAVDSHGVPEHPDSQHQQHYQRRLDGRFQNRRTCERTGHGQGRRRRGLVAQRRRG
jgi:hypothetical protein